MSSKMWRLQLQNKKAYNTKLLLFCSLLAVLGFFNSLAFESIIFFWIPVLAFSLFFICIINASTLKQSIILSIAFSVPMFLSYMDITENFFVNWRLLFMVFYFSAIVTIIVSLPTWYLRHTNSLWLLCFFSLLWAISEWIRGHFLGGFPWMLIGYINLTHIQLAQIFSILGIYTLGLVTTFTITSPALLYIAPKNKLSLVGILFAVLFLLVSYLWGEHRLNSSKVAFWDNVKIRLVHTDFTNKDKSIKQMHKILEKIIIQSSNKLNDDITLIIWPEAAILHLMVSNADKEKLRYNKFLKKIVPLLSSQRYLITGIKVVDIVDATPPEIISKSHGLGVINNHAELQFYYAKNHLVPFVEFVPFKKIFRMKSLLSTVMDKDNMDYDASEEPGLISLPNVPSFTPNICYDGLFSGDLVNKNKSRPDWILVISNDGWFRHTNFISWISEMTRARAIEEGLPLIRVTNLGISTVVDPYGRIINQLPDNVFSNLDVRLPKPLPPTLFGIYGNLLFLFTLIGLALLLILLYPWAKKIPKQLQNVNP